VTVEVDTSKMDRDLARLSTALDTGGRRTARAQAERTADQIRVNVPRRTGRLAGTVTVSSEGDGYAVHYGGSLPYADYIEHRSGAVADGTADADTDFRRALEALTVSEVGRL
jgi:hypothetical protein